MWRTMETSFVLLAARQTTVNAYSPLSSPIPYSPISSSIPPYPPLLPPFLPYTYTILPLIIWMISTYSYITLYTPYTLYTLYLLPLTYKPLLR